MGLFLVSFGVSTEVVRFLHEPDSIGIGGKFNPIVYVDALVDIGDMPSDGVHANHQLACDFLVRFSLSDKKGDIFLAAGET